MMSAENLPVDLPPVERPPRPPLHAASAWQLGLSLLAALILWGLSLSLLGLGLLQRFNPATSALGDSPYFLVAAGTALGGFLMVPSAAYALLRLLGRPAPPNLILRGILLPVSAFLVLALALLLGSWISENGSISWFTLPPLHVLAVGLPVFLLVYLAVRGIPMGSPQRVWGVFAAGSFLGPALIFLLETMAAVVVFLGLLIWISTQPALLNQVTELARQLQGTQPSPQELERLITPLLANPLTLYLVFLFGCVIVPLIEEALKSIGVWLLVGRDLTPAAGFTAGIVSGAGYALVESLAVAGGGSDWAGLVIARMGTAVIHILTTGMIGWALALAWGQGRFLRLGFTYLGNVLVHGLWNGFTLLMAFAAIPELRPLLPFQSIVGAAAAAAPYILVALAGLGFIALIVANRILYYNQVTQPVTDTGPDASVV